MKKNAFYIPKNLNLKLLISNNLTLSKELKVTESKLLFICHSLFYSLTMHRSEMEDKRNSYAPLCSKILDKVIHDYSNSIRFLIETNIISSNNSYSVGHKCKGYRFNVPYSCAEFHAVKICDYKLEKGLQKLKEFFRNENEKSMQGYGFLIRHWKVNKLRINVEAATQWIEINSPSPFISSILKYSVDLINRGKYRFSFSGEGHRHYTLLTNLKRELRNFLTYDNTPMVSIDIKNSQPFLVLALLKSSFWADDSELPGNKLCLNRLNPKIFAQLKIKITNAIIMLLKSSENIADDSDSSLIKYKGLVVNGEIYEYIQEQFCQNHPNKFDNRESTKKEVLKMMNIHPRLEDLPNYTHCKTYASHFPELYQLFRLIKQIDHRFLPIILQRIESFLLIDIICKRINELKPEIPLFTIHDSILTTKGNEGFIKAIMTQELVKWIGSTPKLDIKSLSPKNLFKSGYKKENINATYDFSKILAA